MTAKPCNVSRAVAMFKFDYILSGTMQFQIQQTSGVKDRETSNDNETALNQ